MKHHKLAFYVGLSLLAASGATLFAADDVKTSMKPVAIKPVKHKQLVLDHAMDLTLEDAVRLALTQNPQVLVAIQLIEQTKGQIISVRAQALPSVALASAYTQTDPKLIGAQSTSGNATGSEGSNSGFIQQDKSWDVSVQATQLLYSGGSVNAAIKVAHLTLDSNYYNLRDIVDQTISTVRSQFFDVLLDRELIKVQQESVDLLQSQLKDQQDRFQAGTVPQFNVLQAQVALANQLPLLIKAKNNYLISELALAQTLGIEYDPMRVGQQPLNAIGDLTVHERKINEPEAIRIAKEHRAFLKVQRQGMLVQEQEIKIAQAGYQPTITADAGYQVRSSPFTSDLGTVLNGWYFGVNGSWNIWDSGATYGKVKTARASLESSKANYDNAVLQVELQVQQAIANLQQAQETIESQTKSVEEAKESLRLAQERLHAGAGVQLDVLNAQVALLTAQSNFLQAEHDYNVAMAQFEYAIGAQTHFNDSFTPIPSQKTYTTKTANPPPVNGAGPGKD